MALINAGDETTTASEMNSAPINENAATGTGSEVPQENEMPPHSNNNTHHNEQKEDPIHERDETGHQQNAHHSSGNHTGLRILCLHGAHSSASSLKSALTKLGDRLYQKHGIDLVYINSPLCATVASDTDRVWYETDKQTRKQQQQRTPEASEEDAQQPERLIGLDASICLLQQMWASMPFWGIMGIGQGAAIGSLLSLLPNIKPRAKFGIFMQGEALIQEAECLHADDWSCLHILDPDFLSGTEEKLIQQFGGDVHRICRKGNEFYTKDVMNLVGKFIIEQKKKLRQDDGESMALALQNQLYLAEQEASILIAKNIAKNPPSVLMAVIAPKAVAVGGMKRRGKNEEGGGAPCPPEFLLRRDTRFQGDEEAHKATRVHPEEKNSSSKEDA